MDRSTLINELINTHSYTSYLEIGTRDGWCFNQIQLPHNRKFGVDPDPNAPATHHMLSDEFFKQNDRMFDIIFIDGDHTGEQVYKDIENSLKVLSTTPGPGHIILHDCLPPTKWHTRPIEEFDPTKEEWNGTVWKAMAWFRMRHTGYNSYTINADWGLGVIYPDEHITTPPVKQPENVKSLSDLTYSSYEKNKNFWLNII